MTGSKDGMTESAEYVRETLSGALSSMCFAMAEFVGGGPMEASIQTSIAFRGEVEGELRLAIRPEVAKKLTADFLALKPELVGLEQARSFALELANVVCGHLLSSAAADRHYEVALPVEMENPGSQIFPHCFSIFEGGPEIGLDFQMSVID